VSYKTEELFAAFVADAADFGASYRDVYAAVLGDLLL
jgi:hypothetical protein